MNDMQLVRDERRSANDEVIVDQRQVREDNLHLGDKIELFGEQEL